MIVTGESSGELYGALLAGELRTLWPDIRLIGVGGERMKKSGVELFSGIASSFGITEAVPTYRSVRDSYRKTVDTLKAEKPDVVVLIDYPDFNFRVGREARRMGVRVLYYVSPQVWAWRSGRVKTIREVAERIAVLLPFEEGIYREAGMPCEFVGHPVLDEIDLLPSDRGELRERLGLDPRRPYVALLPGSRNHELRKLLPVMLGVVRRARAELPGHGFVMPLAPNLDVSRFEGLVDALASEGVTVLREGSVQALAASDAAVVASGTAALQAAFVGTPLVVIYKIFPLTYLIGRAFILKVKYVSLVNILLDRPVVKELLQRRADPGLVMEELGKMLHDEGYRQRMLEDFASLRGLFEGKKPSKRVAEIVGEMAGWRA
jgi:lipid-A-disaccharide synthase